MVSDVPNLPSRDTARICTMCEDEVPDEHYVMSHLLTPLTLAVCYECFSRRDTWGDLADEYFSDQVENWQGIRKKEFGDGPPQGF